MSDAVIDAVNGIELELPDGSLRRFRVLKLGEALRLMGLLLEARRGNGNALLQFLEEFTAAMGLEGTELLPGEVFGLADRFFWSSRVEADQIDPSESDPTPTSSSSP